MAGPDLCYLMRFPDLRQLHPIFPCRIKNCWTVKDSPVSSFIAIMHILTCWCLPMKNLFLLPALRQLHAFSGGLSRPMFLSMCLLILLPGFALAEATPPAPAANADVCSPLVASALSDNDFVKAVRAPINEAIETVDNAKIEFSSPSLASGKVSYLAVSPNFTDAQNIANICVIGYFEVNDKRGSHTVPLNVDHIETVKIPLASDPTQFTQSTRIFFRTPSIQDFSNAEGLDQFWKFWNRNEPVRLKFAAFSYQDSTRGKPYFGRTLPVEMSHKHASIFAAWLFAICCYLIAAITISYRADRKQEILPTSMSGLRIFLRKLSPWYVVGSNGQASLSQLQMLLFTLIVATLLFYQWLRTGLLQEISTDLLYLIGISTAGAGGSQITTSLKKNLDAEVYQYAQELGWFTAPMAGAHASAHPSELLLTNNRFDIYKFQMLLFTFVIAAYVIACGANELGNVQISTTLLTLMGISQGAYLGGHAASDNLTPLQDQLRGMKLLQEQWIAASGDRITQVQLEQRFRIASKQAADMFSLIFYRDIPPHMLGMPLTVKSAAAPATVSVVVTPATPADPVVTTVVEAPIDMAMEKTDTTP